MKKILDAAVWFVKAICEICKMAFYGVMLGYIPVTVLVILSALVTDDPDTDVFAVSLVLGVPFYIFLLVGFSVISAESDKRKVKEFEENMKKRQW